MGLAGGPIGLAAGALYDQGKLGSFLFGEDPNDVKLPAEYVAAQQRRGAFRDQLSASLQPGFVTEAERAVQAQTRLAGDQALAQQAALASTGRGFGAVAARSGAAQNAALAQQALAAQGATAAGQVRAAEQARREGMLANLLSEDQQLAMAEEEFRRRNAKPGAFGAILGTLGAGVGGYFGGVQGAQAGGQLGYGLGSATQAAI